MRSWGIAAVLCALAVPLAACSDDSDPVDAPPLSATPDAVPTAYDAELEPNAGVLALVPADAEEVRLTDFDQVRLQLGTPMLTGSSPKPERDRFWRRAATEAPLLDPGLLRGIDGQLEREFGWTQDDVAWEAHFEGPDGAGWVLKIRDDLPMGDITRAVEAGLGPLSEATVLAEDHLVVLGAATDPAESWAADPDLAALVGVAGSSTYVVRGCVPVDVALGPGVQEALAPSPAADLADLDELEAFSVVFGGELATVRLGPDRPDAFDRMRLAETLPETDPAFGRGYRGGVADPQGGRIGYTLADPTLATRLALERQLPFAVCPE